MMAVSAIASCSDPGETTADLRDRLARLSKDSGAYAARRRATTTQEDTFLRLVIQEVDETLLPRQFNVMQQDKILARLVMSNRRLSHMLVGDRAVLLSGIDETDVMTTARAYVTALRRLATNHDALTLHPAGRAPHGVSDNMAASAAHLNEAARAPHEEKPLQRLLEEFAPHASGWMAMLAGRMLISRDCPSPISDAMQRAARALAGPQKAPRRSRHFDQITPTCTRLPFSDEIHLFCVGDHADMVVLALPIHSTDAVFDTWRALFGRR